MTIAKRSFSKQRAIVASLALLTMGLSGTVATGAYFTAEKTVADNTLAAGTVAIGNIGDDSNSVAALEFTNILPIANADVPTKAQMFNINVRNTGTAAVDWKAAINVSDVTNFSKAVYVQYSLDGGATWSIGGSIGGSMNGTAIPSTSSLAAGATSVIKLRAWIPANMDNTAQGKTVSFSLTVNAIQCLTLRLTKSWRLAR